MILCWEYFLFNNFIEYLVMFIVKLIFYIEFRRIFIVCGCVNIINEILWKLKSNMWFKNYFFNY